MEELSAIIILILVVAAIYFIVRKRQKILMNLPSRRCLFCGFIGPMKTWLSNYGLPQLITILLLFFYIIPGLIFIAWNWGKYKCPQCGALAKNVTNLSVSQSSNGEHI
jgi:hypothetical protein